MLKHGFSLQYLEHFAWFLLLFWEAVMTHHLVALDWGLSCRGSRKSRLDWCSISTRTRSRPLCGIYTFRMLAAVMTLSPVLSEPLRLSAAGTTKNKRTDVAWWSCPEGSKRRKERALTPGPASWKLGEKCHLFYFLRRRCLWVSHITF